MKSVPKDMSDKANMSNMLAHLDLEIGGKLEKMTHENSVFCNFEVDATVFRMMCERSGN